ncbi:b(0,+)-type amino acid transporter 1-like [Agrilus planipennis]|uniref:B(0,+)-type amino acid transporter 1-like n=1 Tax=Agrilus planipennis TaxID=224129 RepID=A0A7F5R697_AGRPL|nr:b(0,+)-type amino acid transporter 1-like [Agrilus planipennis]
MPTEHYCMHVQLKHTRDLFYYISKTNISFYFFSVVILYVNCYSVNLATSVQNVFTAAKLVAILIVILGGAYKIIEGNVQHLQHPFRGTKYNLGNIATAFYTGLWAYDGWNNLNYVTEEIKNPSK